MIGIMSCKDPCEGIVNGIEIEGVCECLENYEGELCDTESREKFYGDFEGVLSGCTIDIPVLGEYEIPDFPISLSIAENADDIAVVNATVGMSEGTATIDGSEMTLEPTTMEIEAGPIPVILTLAGVGTLSSDNNQIDMALEISVSGGQNTCPVLLNRI